MDLNNLRGGYTQEQLEEAFKLVQNKEHWKGEIDATIPLDSDIKLVCFAVGYFTGGFADYEETPEGYRVTADGYWVSCGA